MTYIIVKEELELQTEREHKVKLRAINLIKRHHQQDCDYKVTFKGLKLRLKQGVFCAAFADGSNLLADCLIQEVRSHETVLDMGTGSGALGILAARSGASVVAVDISPIAVNCARDNARLNNLQNTVDVRQSNLFASIRSDEKFSLILFNPPFMNGQPSSLLEVAMYDEGYATLTQFFEEFPKYLAAKGRVLIVFSESGDVAYLKKLMTNSGFDWSLVDSSIPEDSQLAVLVYELKRGF